MGIPLSSNRVDDPAEAARRFEDLFDRHHIAVFKYCARRLDRPDADDAAAEVFAVAWNRLDVLPEGGAERAWLLTVAYKVIGNQYRSQARRFRLRTRLAALSKEHTDPTDWSEEGAAVITALSRLSPSDQELLRLAAWEDLANPEIAVVLGIKVNAVAQRLFRARNRLKAHFEIVAAERAEEAAR